MVLEQKPTVEAAHQDGVWYSTRGYFKAARDCFSEARNRADAEYHRSVHPQGSPAKRLHLGRIARDEALNCLRESPLADGAQQEGLIDTAFQVGAHSRRLIEGVGAHYSVEREPERFRQANDELGATLTTLGRAAMTRATLQDAPNYLQVAYGHCLQAESILSQGDNLYYRVSNLVHLARAEKLDGYTLQAWRWIGRATLATWRARHTEDKENLRRARNTILGRLPDLRSRRALRASVRRTRPRRFIDRGKVVNI